MRNFVSTKSAQSAFWPLYECFFFNLSLSWLLSSLPLLFLLPPPTSSPSSPYLLTLPPHPASSPYLLTLPPHPTSSPYLLTLLHLLLLLPQASMRHCGQYLSLAVPGLAERRPSLLLGDRVIVCEPGENPTCTTYASSLIVNSYPLIPGHVGGVEEGIVRESMGEVWRKGL